MKVYLQSMACGAATEAVLVFLMLFGGMGPCGPGSLLGMLLLFLHEPGIWLSSFLPIHADYPVYLALILYAGIWSSLWYLFWRDRSRPTNSP